MKQVVCKSFLCLFLFPAAYEKFPAGLQVDRPVLIDGGDLGEIKEKSATAEIETASVREKCYKLREGEAGNDIPLHSVDDQSVVLGLRIENIVQKDPTEGGLSLPRRRGDLDIGWIGERIADLIQAPVKVTFIDRL